MVKKFTPPTRATQSRSSICLPLGMVEAMEQAIVAAGGSLKRRSNWIAAACADLLDNPEREALINEEFYDGKTKTLPLTIDTALMRRLDDLAECMTTPSRTIDRSSVIRTAITQAVLAAKGRRLSVRAYQPDAIPDGDSRQEAP